MAVPMLGPFIVVTIVVRMVAVGRRVDRCRESRAQQMPMRPAVRMAVDVTAMAVGRSSVNAFHMRLSRPPGKSPGAANASSAILRHRPWAVSSTAGQPVFPPDSDLPRARQLRACWCPELLPPAADGVAASVGRERMSARP